jgi:hypothetical protein
MEEGKKATHCVGKTHFSVYRESALSLFFLRRSRAVLSFLTKTHVRAS